MPGPGAADIARLTQELVEARRRLAEARRQRYRLGPVPDYALRDAAGRTVPLSSLFGRHDDLLVVHNMGRGCPYCTLWADGFAGLTPHLLDRCAFVLVSADEPEEAAAFAAQRHWPFLVLSGAGSAFTHEMGFASEAGEPWPGVSAFRRDPDGTIRRVDAAPFGPGDDFCALWHLLDLLESGPGGWEPKHSYT